MILCQQKWSQACSLKLCQHEQDAIYIQEQQDIGNDVIPAVQEVVQANRFDRDGMDDHDVDSIHACFFMIGKSHAVIDLSFLFPREESVMEHGKFSDKDFGSSMIR